MKSFSIKEGVSLHHIEADKFKTFSVSMYIHRPLSHDEVTKNALLPAVTVLGPMIAGLLTGSFVIEKIFALPGMGKYFVLAVSNRDYPAILGTTLFFAVFFVCMTFVVDLLYCVIDPRIKLA